MKPCKNLILFVFLLSLPLYAFAQTEVDSVRLQGPVFADTVWHFEWQIFPPLADTTYNCMLRYSVMVCSGKTFLAIW